MIYKTCYYSNDYVFKSSAIVREFRHQSDFIRSISENSDAMIFMKGGSSTIAEIMYAIDAKKNKEHDKPIVILNINNEWKELVNLLNSFNINDVYYVESQLFNKTSSFSHYLQFMERQEPIIENSDTFLKKR